MNAFRRFGSTLLVACMAVQGCGDDGGVPGYPEPCQGDACYECSEEGRPGADGTVCADGRYVPCGDVAPGTHCLACGCPNGDACFGATDMCGLALKRAGEPCEDDEECGSQTCRAPFDDPEGALICAAELGESCTSHSCAQCVSDGSNSYCSQGCSGPDSPSVVQNVFGTFLCISNLDTSVDRYLPACDAGGGCELLDHECTQAGGRDAFYCNPVEDTSTTFDVGFAVSNLESLRGTPLGSVKDMRFCSQCACDELSLDTDQGTARGCGYDFDWPFFVITQEGTSQELGVFLMRTLLLEYGTNLRIQGSRPLVLAAQNRLTLEVELVAPGGFQPAAGNGAAQGPGVGVSVPSAPEEGGAEGASYCSAGALGANVAPAGGDRRYGRPDLVPLIAGSAGGSHVAASANRGIGGAGGGAVQITAGRSIQIEPLGAILAVGAKGLVGADDCVNCGTGGGSGGAILLEAPNVVVAGRLDASGGDGGGLPDDRGLGARGIEPATAGTSGQSEGGGGGGAGRIRVNTATGAEFTSEALLSPATNACLQEGVLTL